MLWIADFCTFSNIKRIQKNKEYISQVYTFDDVEKNEKEGKISALLSLEEGAIFEKSPEDLQWFYDQGARIATFTWNYENMLGYPNHFGDPMKERPWSTGNENGLKKRGLEVLEQMEVSGMWPMRQNARFLQHIPTQEEQHQMRNGAGMQSLAEAMERAGMTCKLIERICYGNVKRFLRENL